VLRAGAFRRCAVDGAVDPFRRRLLGQNRGTGGVDRRIALICGSFDASFHAS